MDSSLNDRSRVRLLCMDERDTRRREAAGLRCPDGGDAGGMQRDAAARRQPHAVAARRPAGELHETLPGCHPVPGSLGRGWRLVASLPKDEHSFDFFNSDIAFWGDMLVGAVTTDSAWSTSRRPRSARLIADVECRGPQGDVSIWEDLVFVSVDRPQTTPGCDSQDAENADPLFVPPKAAGKVSRLRHLAAAPASTAHLRVHRLRVAHEHPGARSRARPPLAVRQLIRAGHSARPGARAASARGHFSVVEVPLDDPESARVIAEPHLFDTPVWNVWPGAGSSDTAAGTTSHLRATTHLAAARVRGRGSDLGPQRAAAADGAVTSTSPT